MIAAPPIPVELHGYLDELVDAIRSVADLDAAYLLGSAALGAYQHGSSDVDVVAVTARPLPRVERRALAETAEAIPCSGVSKPVAAEWLRDRVRSEIAERR